MVLGYVLFGLLAVVTAVVAFFAVQGEHPSVWGIWSPPTLGRL